MKRLVSLSTGAVVLAWTLSAPALASEEIGPFQFNRDIRPILSASCVPCHGPDEKRRKAKLRLDLESGIREVFGGGKLDESEAWKRITSDDPDERMPPEEAPRRLEGEEIRTLRRWIETGAAWEGHWAFIAPRKPSIPEVRRADRDGAEYRPIDAFVVARLEREGLRLGPEADRERLLRRVTLDLTGLPPSLEEIDAFGADDSPVAYERVVDRLLASKHFGERMALAWMDAARYGDSSVFHADGPRDMWPWRDWVIEAYNANKPFDEFTVEQLAGDLLPDATVRQQIASGFNRNNATTDEGGAIAEEYRVEYVVDRVKTTSMVWMGLSMECGQCHDHKYDPISQTEYYRFFAYFNQASDPGMQSRGGNQSPLVNVPNWEGLERAKALKPGLEDVEKQLAKREREAETPFLAWLEKTELESGKRPTLPGDLVAHLALDEKEGGEFQDAVVADRRAPIRGKKLFDSGGKHGGAFRCDTSNFVDWGDVGDFERTDGFSYGVWVKPEGKKISGSPIARMDTGNGHRGYDIMFQDGRVSVHIIHRWPDNAIKVVTKAKVKPKTWHHVFATYDGSSQASGIKIYIDGKAEEWTIEQNGLKDTIRTDKPLYLGRRNSGGSFRGSIDDARVYSRGLSPEEVAAISGSDPLRPILATPREKRTDEQTDTLRRHFLNNHDEPYREVAGRLAKLRSEVAALEKPVSTVMVMRDVDKPRMTYILNRGNYASPLKDRPVRPGTPAALPPLGEESPANRLGLARWLVRPDHPLTARVTVNRYWYMLFGQGIVRTLGDFGTQGKWPTHPELLDWLAVDFVENGWNIKRTLKQMLLSATYRQSARVTPELLNRDPENRLLSRGPRFRLQGEFIRDNALAASGLLVTEIGGPSVKPYQPPGLWNEVSLSGNVRFKQDQGEKLYRRSMYTYWKRSAPAPSMTIFDAPTREKCTLQRSRTNTPLQALVTLNDPQFVEAARVLAERVLKAESSLKARIVRGYRLATGVRPAEAVLSILEQSYEDELRVFEKNTQGAEALLKVGESPRDASLDVSEHAALTVVMSLILNLDETLTRG